MQEMLGERPMDVTVRTMEEAVCLVIGREEFRTLMADDTELIQGMFSMASGGGPVGIPQWVAKGTGGATAAHPDLTPVEKVFLISGNPFFGGVGGEEVQSLGSIAAVVRLEAGTVLSEEPDPPSVYVVAAGGITLDTLPDEPASEAGPTDAAGIRHTLTGSPPGRRVSVLSEGLALRIDRDDLFELLAQRPDLLRQVLGAASRSWAAKQAAPA
jgi:CRP-like cAMP-binding protein